MGSKARILHCGEQAFSIELADKIDENVNLRIITLAKDLEADPPDGLIELIPSYRSLLVCFSTVAHPDGLWWRGRIGPRLSCR